MAGEAGMAGTLRGILIGTIPGTAIVRGGLTLPGTVPVGDSDGDGAVSMPAGAVRGTARRGAGVITARATGAEAIGGITITTITTTRITTGRRDARHRVGMHPEEDLLPIAIRVPTGPLLTEAPAVRLL